MDGLASTLRSACPSFFSSADQTFFAAVQCLDAAAEAASAGDAAARTRLSEQAMQLLAQVPESADLLSVCQRFETVG